MTSIIVFAVSLALLGLFLGFKSWEERRGVALFAGHRARLDVGVEHLSHYLRFEVPVRLRLAVRYAIEHTLRGTSVGLMHFGNAVRRDLHKIAERIDGRVDLKRRGVASFYLREVAEHKRSLATATSPRPTRAI